MANFHRFKLEKCEIPVIGAQNLLATISSPPTIQQHQTSCVLFELDHTFNKRLGKVIKAKLATFYVLSVYVYFLLKTSDFPSSHLK